MRFSILLRIFAGCWCCLNGVTLALADEAAKPAPSPEAVVFFETHVRPVLAAHCFECHGEKKQESGLRLDTRPALMRGGDSGEVVVAGKPDESYLVELIRHEGSVKMPPATKLADKDIQALTTWVEQGLPWPQEAAHKGSDDRSTRAANHWAFQPVERPEIPLVANDVWSQSPVDRFILRQLHENKLATAPRASKAVLMRRVTFDLIGLPPTPDEIEAFLADESPDAYERLVDRLLASPHYGERWGRHWLDVARYADNKGYVFFEDKKYPWAYAYRDYVVRALNDDLPYDRFLKEQLAADQLDLGKEKWRLAAMGFLTVGPHFMNNLHDILDDRIDVVTRGLLGLTVSCARCHDHKFDPIPAADYYSLYGIFRSSIEPTLPPALRDPPDSEEFRKFQAEMDARLKKLNDFVSAKHNQLMTSARTRAAEYLLAAQAQRDQPPTDDFMLIADPGDLNPLMIVRWQTLLDKTRRRPDPIWLPWHALADLPAERFGAEAPQVVERLRSAAAAGEAINPLVLAELAKKPLTSLADVAGCYSELLNRLDQQWRVNPQAESVPNSPEGQLRRVFYGPDAPPEVPMVAGWGFLSLLPDRAAQEEYKKVLKEVETWSTTGPGAPARAMVLVDADRPYDPRIFLRGSPNRLGESVPRRFLACLETDRKPFSRGSGRLELAGRIASAENPLTARVLVNRIWLHHFGEGLVATPSDFGLRGEPPTHPELLDWLASEFVRGGWSIKRLHRTIVLSATYQQASGGSSLVNRRRLDFESMRDSLLSVAGNLDTQLGGPAIEIFGAESAPRRTIYGFIDRLDVPGVLTTFDFPSPVASSPQRQDTLVAPQSLYLMNSPFAADVARRFAERVDLVSLEQRDKRIERMYLIAFARRPSAREVQIAGNFLGNQPAAEQWEQFAHALLMANELVFVD